MKARAVVVASTTLGMLVGLSGCYSVVEQAPYIPEDWATSSPAPVAPSDSTVTVPNVVGLETNEALARLDGLELEIGVVGSAKAGARDSGWTIESQSIAPGTTVPKGSRLLLIFS